MSSRTIRNMQSLIDGAAAGDGYSKMMLEGMAEERHRKENPEYYKRVVYNPGYSGLRDVHRNDVTNSFIEDQKKEINSDLDAMYRPTYSNDVVVSGKTPRGRSPTRHSNKVAAEAKDAEEVEKNKWYLGKHIVSAYKSLTPSARAKSSFASTTLTKGRTHTLVRPKHMRGRKFEKEGGSKKTRKNKKSSRRNRK